MPSLRYLHLDVFTDTPFAGNQLAVFPQPGSLTTDTMQRIANEMAFSETTFVYPAGGGGDVKMRIFTPGEELPIAGHPTIGSTFALALEGVIAKGREHFVFELGVGPTPVSLEWRGNELAFAWMTQPNPEFAVRLADIPGLAKSLGLDASEISANAPVQIVSCGVPYLMVPIASRAAVDAVTVDRKGVARCLEAAGAPERPVFLFTLDGRREGETVYSRMLAPSFGITEDPATGSASGPLGSYLVQYRLVTPETARSLVSLQGVAMGRPSRIHISIDGAPGAITRVRVGGTSVMVGSGTLHVV
jgi:trans-2,3-dihydro-3-hydroxyanthranilate isomerase